MIQTERLTLREFTEADAPFVLSLLQSPGWLQHIGDRGVYDLDSARGYIRKLEGSYREFGYGLWLAALKEDGRPIGMCGLLKRPTLPVEDIGYALLPEYAGRGYAEEAARATLQAARSRWGIDRVLAITTHANLRSIRLLWQLGFHLEKSIYMEGDEEELLLFSTVPEAVAIGEIDELTRRFFALFTNADGATPDLDRIYELFVPEGTIIRNAGDRPEVYTLASFIEPRKRLLTDGTLTGFREEEVAADTRISGRIAQRFSFYRKSGILSGQAFETSGVKTMQFVRTAAGWRMSSVAWDDL